MPTRRLLLSALAAAPLCAVSLAALADEPTDPMSIVRSIYTRAAKGKGDGGGMFLTDGSENRAKTMSASLCKLWSDAEAHAPKDEPGPVDFDPVSNSQDPDIKSYTVTLEKLDSDHASVAAIVTGHHGPREKPVDAMIHYDFVREDGAWKIDDIRGTVDAEPWSVRDMLAQSLKN